MDTFVSLKQLDQILDTTVGAIEEGKNDIFDLSEKAQKDIMSIDTEYTILQARLKILIKDVDDIEALEKNSRKRLAELSKKFGSYSEEQVREAYEQAQELRVRLTLKKQEEKELFMMRSALEQRLHDAKDVRVKAEKLTSKVSFALEYLKSTMSEQLEDLKNKKDIGIRIIQAQENERQRMSREIHDGPAQMMANLVVKTEYTERLMDKDIDLARKEMQFLKDNLRDSLKATRKIIYDLMPMSLDDLGLVPTVKKLIDDHERNHEIRIKFNQDIKYKIVIPIINLTVFRIIQEGFNNIAKHSKCKAANLEVKIGEKEVFIRIEDDGVGFDPSAIEASASVESGFGLYNIRERIDYLEGEFEVKSKRGKGTLLLAKIPLKEGEVREYGKND